MAEEQDSESKTEPPSPKRLLEAYEQGQFAFSSELNTGVLVLVGIAVLAYMAHTIGGFLLRRLREDLAFRVHPRITMEVVPAMLGDLFLQATLIIGGVVGALFISAIGVNIAQAGLRFNTDRLIPDPEKMNLWDVSRVLSWGKLPRGFVVILKLVAVCAAAWWVLRDCGPEISRIGDFGLGGGVSQAWAIIMRLALAMAAVLLAIGVVDYAWQRWRFEQSLYMTKDELKREAKDDQVDPKVKGQMRRLRLEASKRKMFKETETATVVVTNPTHIAVALKYEPGMAAPVVVAKGAGHVAARIVAIARANKVLVVERKPIARALYKMGRVNKEIPLALYVVVAELLKYVYEVKGIEMPRRPAA